MMAAGPYGRKQVHEHGARKACYDDPFESVTAGVDEE